MKYNLEVENLSKAYPDFCLDNVSFRIPCGSIMGFVGENGAGKTTTISAVLNTIKRDGGTVKVFGQEMRDQDTALREDIGVVFDAINFSAELTPKQLSNVMSCIYKAWDSDYFFSKLTELQVPLQKKLQQFSRGMRMKLAIVAALSHSPKLLFLDEATSGLDPVVREEVLDLFLEFVADESHSILMSSHITGDLEKVADYITFIHNGKIILTEQKDTLLYDYGIARCKAEQVRGLEPGEILSTRDKGHQVDVLVKDKKAFAKKHSDIVVDNTTIDEIMLLLVKKEVVL